MPAAPLVPYLYLAPEICSLHVGVRVTVRVTMGLTQRTDERLTSA